MCRPDISVVVCTYNRAEMLRDALNSLMRQDTGGQFSYEVIVVDDASTDATPNVVIEAALRSPTPVRYVPGTGKGIACARNRGIKESSADRIAFFDDDQLAEPNWLKELHALALKTGSGCVGGARALLLTVQELSGLSPECRGILGEIALGNEPMKCGRKQFPCTGNMLLKRSVFDQVDQFNESLTRGGEDIEFTARFRLAGHEAWFAPKAIVHHYVPAYRLKGSYLIWAALRYGDSVAYRDFREWGLARTVIACLARIGQAFLINFPLMLLAYILGNRAEVIGRKCSLVRAWGYLRQSLYLVSPRLFSQETYFGHLSFRGERNAFASSSKSTECSNASE